MIYTDACTEVGCGGFIRGLGTTIYFQIEWVDTIKAVIEKYRDLEIDVLELLMSVAAVRLIHKFVTSKTITIYNDNPGAAAALRTKAPPLGRNDMQALIYDNKFYWWGIHRVVKESSDMRIADKLSRFQHVQWTRKLSHLKRF